MRRAIIGGTGVYDVDSNVVIRIISTEYGEVEVQIRMVNGKEIVFLPRHGKGHSKPPHLINYRANIMALKELGVTHIYSTCAVGSLNDAYGLGDVMLITDFLDFTKARIHTFHDGSDGVKHTDMSDPYCKNLRENFQDKAKEFNIDIKGSGVYVCTEGPRFETASEIKMYGKMGGDVVGMTNVPEVVLAKELGICYSAIGIVTNWCTGFKSDDIQMHDISAFVAKNKEGITNCFIEILSSEIEEDKCNCKNSVLKL
ncbi:MAG: MTAP family purine nucleoside phosphorylase [Acidaminobacteraceae bacterium]